MPPASEADSSNSIAVQRSNFQFVIDKPGVADEIYLLRVIVSGNQNGRLTIGFRDSQNLANRGEMFPAGTLSTSLANVLELQHQDLTYDGQSSSKIFELRFQPKGNHARQLFQGYIAISFSPADSSSVGSSNAVGALSPLVVVPYGLAETAEPGVFKPSEISRLEVRSDTRLSFIDNLLPDIPGLINVGPVESTFTVTNPGSAPNFTGLRFSILKGDEVYVSQTSAKKLMLPSQSEMFSFKSVIRDKQTGREINVLPNFGLFTIEIASISDLSGKESPPVIAKRVFLIAPWKEAVVFISVTWFVLSWLLRRRREAHQSNELERSTQGV